MTGNNVDLIEARPDDSDFIWRLRSDPRIYEFSGTPEPVEWATHEAWFARASLDPDRRILVAKVGGQRVGVVRFDRLPSAHVAEVSISIDPDLQGRGLGTAVLNAALSQARAFAITVVSATGHRSNRRSLQLFERQGFVGDAAANSEWLHLLWRARDGSI